MLVKFRGKTIDVPNESCGSDFESTWNCFTIEICKNERIHYMSNEYYREHKYTTTVINPLGSYIVDGFESSTIKRCLQEALDNICSDINDLESKVSEKEQLIHDYGHEIIEEIDEAEYWLSQMKL